MNYTQNGFIISDDKALIQADRVHEMLSKTYWAAQRPFEANLKAIENSLCFGAYKYNVQVGFARVMTDYATTFYLCDVVVEEEYRGNGLGREMMKLIMKNEELSGLVGILYTRNAHKLYEQFNFESVEGVFMRKASN